MTSAGSSSPNPHLVLCVDDELVGLNVRRILLERSGYKVLTAQNGTEALHLFREQPVEAVILDYSMPGMQGAEIAVLMRQSKPEVPIMLLSAYLGLPDDVISTVNIYMTKGEGAPLLLEKLSSLFPVAGAVEIS